MEFRILGPLEVLDNGRGVDLGAQKHRALLATLLLRANEVVSSDRLIEALWEEEPPETAQKALQVYVFQLRKSLGKERIERREPGYLLRVEQGELDLECFQELAGAGQLDEALRLWRGSPLAEFAYQRFAQAEIVRLEELHLACLEQRIDRDLSEGRHAQVVGELEALVKEHPLREGLRGQLMLACYRSGRQAEALATYQDCRDVLDEGLGLEPSESLKRLQTAILRHDPSLDAASDATAPGESRSAKRSILVVGRALGSFPALLSLVEALARSEPPRELILAHVTGRDALGHASAALNERCGRLLEHGLVARAAAFSSPCPSDDLVRLAAEYEVDLMLLDAGPTVSDDTTAVLNGASCDVALLVEAGGPRRAGPVIVPFGAAEHDWAALELGAWVAQATGEPLRLIGAASDQREDGRDASRLLADASLIVQRTAGVFAEPLLATPGREGVMALAEDAGLLVMGLSERWRQEGLGKVRSEIASAPPAPTVFVRRGPRPGGLAPAESRTRFTWSLTSAAR